MRIQDAIAAMNRMEAFAESGALPAAQFQNVIGRSGLQTAWEKFTRHFLGRAK
jgi:hypothetical protein